MTANFLLALPLAYYGFFHQTYVSMEEVATATLAFLAATLFFSPDLDLSQSRPTQNWGVFKFIWCGYHRICKHRGSSHSILFSSLTKLIYLFLLSSIGFSIFIFFSYLFKDREPQLAFSHTHETLWQRSEEVYHFVILHQDRFLAALAGIVLSDWTHILTDKFFSLIRRFRSN